MSWFYVDTQAERGDERNAGAKAPADVSAILAAHGLKPLVLPDLADRSEAGIVRKIAGHREALRHWLAAVRRLDDGDALVMQLPFACHTIFFGRVVAAMRKRHIKLVLLIHDLESVRLGLTGDVSFAQARRFGLEESAAFSYAQAIVVHNARMADFVAQRMKYPRERLVPLWLFDYLAPGFEMPPRDENAFRRVIVAGNLRRDKAGYLYDIPDDVDFVYYGVGYEADPSKPRVSYRGSFPADELPMEFESGFGLVWDGPEGGTCSGVYGTYLTINNPHKASLYLASGLPIITWKKAALAEVVEREGVGLCVESLFELGEVLRSVSADDYARLADNAARVGERLRSGAYTMDAVRTACAIAEG